MPDQRIPIAHEPAATLSGDDEVLATEHGQGVADGLTARVEPLNQVGFGRQSLTRRQLAVEDHVAKLGRDALVQWLAHGAQTSKHVTCTDRITVSVLVS